MSIMCSAGLLLPWHRSSLHWMPLVAATSVEEVIEQIQPGSNHKEEVICKPRDAQVLLPSKDLENLSSPGCEAARGKCERT